jgi:hypothetical protein
MKGFYTAIFIAVFSFAILADQKKDPLFGEGWGLDHVGVFVRNLEDCNRAYSEKLGFKVFPGGSFPDGARGGGVLLEKNYLELLTVDPQKATGTAVERLKFLEKHEGAVFLAFNVSSADSTSDYLRSRNIEIIAPKKTSITLEGKKKPELFKIINFSKPAILPTEIFFIEYTQISKGEKKPSPLDEFRKHPNTAKRIHAAWVAVKDLDKAAKAFDSVGLRSKRSLKVAKVAGIGREFGAGEGVILLLQGDNLRSDVSSFLNERGEGIMGVSIQVKNLETAQKFIETAIQDKFEIYDGIYGKSILISPQETSGIWIELFQIK